jgi:AraC-like DNA-binding protein
MPSPLSDEDTFRANLAKSRELKMMLSRDRSDVAHLVNTLLRSHFDRRLSNTAIHPDIPSLERLANELAMSKRTLIRKLSKQGTSYKGILEAIRHELAEMLLKTTHLTAAEIAFKLGYHEAANFGRAFRRWTGISPAAWRRQESHS